MFSKRHNITESEYAGIHYWLKKKYGKATKCEKVDCLGRSQRYEWALKPKHKYLKKRINFFQLCKSCHIKLDMSPNFPEIMREYNVNTHKSHCIRGHEFNENNSYIIIRNTNDTKIRRCRVCEMIRRESFFKKNPNYNHNYYKNHRGKLVASKENK